MRLLLDSHTLLWWMDDPTQLKPAARAAISDPSNLVFTSAASIWELGLKVSKGKLRLPLSFHQLLQENGISELPFTSEHAIASTTLPPLHDDPFDRALVAQCRLESMTLATRDSLLGDYGIAILSV
ncbi:type II toxin-antitoxin system VapC family toxin [Haloferula chungangensis]|uniref:Type II toxin-antitoxin system VapC family toxin n=1 Tax=Haloferula chungangensis TaxID=1048331 RepID=A0ABW2L1G7_9BACT